MNKAQFLSMQSAVVKELERRAEDGWVTVGAVKTALLHWLESSQRPTDATYIVGWRSIGERLGLSAGTCQVYSSRGQFGDMTPSLINGHPAYTEAELDLLKSSLSQRKFNRKVSSPPT